MTYLTKTIKRISTAKIREAGEERDIVVILRTHGLIGFRAKGCRKEYQLPLDACYTMAVKATTLASKREKAKKGLSGSQKT